MIVVDITQLSNQPQLPPASDKYIHRLPQFGRLCLVALYSFSTQQKCEPAPGALHNSAGALLLSSPFDPNCRRKAKCFQTAWRGRDSAMVQVRWVQ